jgi:hypothetical protein
MSPVYPRTYIVSPISATAALPAPPVIERNFETGELMTFRAKWLWVVPALMGAAVACGSNRDRAKETATWSTAPRTISYRVDESFANEKQTFDLKLDFKTDGVDVVELDTPAAGTMDGSGRFSYASGPQAPVIYELIALSVLPPKGEGLSVGRTWSYTRPDDAAALTSKGIVAQERFDYEITSLDSEKIVVSVRGFLRIAPSAGLTDALAKSGLPAATADLVGTYKPYVVGNAEFDRASGETLSASGLRVPFAFLTPGDAIEPGKPAVQYNLIRQ